MQINPKPGIEIQTIGNEKTPIVIVDDVLTDCSGLINIAVKETAFGMINSSMYPGVRAILPKQYVMLILRAVAAPLDKIYGIPQDKRLTPFGTYFSLVSIPQAELHALQKAPHFDSAETLYFAMIHYLDPKPHGGTGFFRHKSTGFERITPERKDSYLKILKHKVENNSDENSEASNGYVSKTDSDFELFHTVDYKPNRLVLYPGGILHSGLIVEDTDISSDPANGRLTANMFINFV
jgi:hypothetical protein